MRVSNLPRITVGAPEVIQEQTPPPTYDVKKVCRVVDGDAEIYIQKNENHDVWVVVNSGGMILPQAIVKMKSERMFGKFKKKNCEECEDYVALWDVGVD